MFSINLKRTVVLYKTKHNTRFKHNWIQPEGFRTNLKIYNCVTRQKEYFIANKNAVTWYTCGPTVYDSSHIGHAACYVRLDIIQRILREYFKFNLVTCMNITDIDDKIIKKSAETKISHKAIVQQYEKEFWEDLKLLQIPKPDITVRVMENIHLIIDFIKNLEDNGVAYKGLDNSVYFDVSKGYSVYGKLQNIGDSPPDGGNPYKKSPVDFALWKSVKNVNEPSFDSPWGFGRPGWHIECSTLATSIFGSNIDIHAGGIDLKFPHHENEEAQSCALHKKHQWVNYWIHTGHLHLKDAVKMSKSLKNSISIKEMLEGTSCEVFRLFCAMSHYSHPIEYSEKLLDTPKNILKVYKNFIITCEDIEKGFIKPSLDYNSLWAIISDSFHEIDKALCDNFNTPVVVQTLNQNISKINAMIQSSALSNENITDNIYLVLAFRHLLSSTLELFGIQLNQAVSNREHDESVKLIDVLIKFRQEVRTLGLESKNKDLLTMCDSVRDSLRDCGVSVKDYGKASSWSR